MLKFIGKLGLFLISSIIVTSCATKEQIVYFDGAKNLEGQENLLEYEPVIQKNDVLRITVSSSSVNEEIVEPFQHPMMRQGGRTGGGGQDQSLMGYLVGSNGKIQFPVVGSVKVIGLTRTEIQEILELKIEEYVKDPIVDVRIINFSVTVLGEVGSPGRVQVSDERITMPELLAMAGDITYNGKRRNITIIREENGVKSVGEIDMTETDLFTSPYFYLKQNDLVYVEPNYRTVKSAGFFSSPGAVLGLVSSTLSLIFIFTR